MTAEEMDISLQVQLRLLNTNSTKSFLPEERELYLNKAQDRFIAGKMKKRDDVNQYDVIDVEAIDVLYVVDRLDVVLNNIKLPKALDYFVRASVSGLCGEIPINLIKSSMISQVNTTPFYRSSNKKMITELINNVLILYPHKNTDDLKASTVVYVRKPNKIQVSSNNNYKDCELRSLYHENIVEMAVSLMKSDGRFDDAQQKQNEIKQNSVNIG